MKVICALLNIFVLTCMIASFIVLNSLSSFGFNENYFASTKTISQMHSVNKKKLSYSESDSFQNRIFTGLEDGANFGVSVSAAGDVNGDGYGDIIVGAIGGHWSNDFNAADVINVFNDANNFVSGYVQTDVTGDNFVDVADLILTYNNSINFVSVIRP